MGDDRHARAGDLFLRALELEGTERDRFLDEGCAGDAALRAEVERLLAHDETDLSERVGSAVNAVVGEAVRAPTVIGGFRILRLIGAGGMGVVYEAEQTNPSRRVALKLVRGGLASESNLRRFQHESEVLAWLDHPGIAHVYQAGTEETGYGEQPWFAMELVRGEPLTEYARRVNLDVAGRVSLLDRVCAAVQHAHGKGVVHRDLKPGNILVDERGNPKVLDFGVARVLDGELVSRSLATGTGELIGTLPYMSPEQVAGDPTRVDVRTDVYALGVIAYELLSGRRPHDLGELSLPSAARVIQQDEPEPLGRLVPGLDRDLVTIVHKALEKEPNRRYASVADLRNDLSLYQRELPILARPVSASYRVAKFARRNRLALAAVAVVVLGLVAGLVTALLGLDRAVTERNEKEAALTESEAASQFLANVLEAASPANQGRDVLLRDVLTAAAPAIDRDFADQPRVAARLHMTMAKTYFALGLPEMLDHARAAHALHVAHYGERSAQAMASLCLLSELLMTLGREEESLGLLERGLEIGPTVLAEGDRTLLEMGRLRGMLLQKAGAATEAAKVLREAASEQAGSLGEDDIATLASESQYAVSLAQSGKLAEAAVLLEENLHRTERLLGSDHPETLTALYNLATAFVMMGRIREAMEIDERLLESRRRVLGEDHASTLRSKMAVAAHYRVCGRYDEAEALLAEAVEKSRALLGETHPQTLEALEGVAMLHAYRHEFDEAAQVAGEVAAEWKRIAGPDHPQTLNIQGFLGSYLAKAGKHDEALALLEDCMERSERTRGPTHRESLILALQYANALVAADSPEQALEMLEATVENAAADAVSNASELRAARAALAETLLDAPADLRDPERALDLARLATDDVDEDRCDQLLVLAKAHLALGQTAEALLVLARIEALMPADGVDPESVRALRATCEARDQASERE